MIDKKIKKYVVANADTGEYLNVELRNKKYYFVDDIERATKAADYDVAEIIMNRYYSDNKDVEHNMVIIPVLITYELLEEEHEEKDELFDLYTSMFQDGTQKAKLSDGTDCFIKFL